MPQIDEKDDIGRFFKGKLDDLEETPDFDLKEQLFERMDMLEGKRPKTIYLHFNVFGMKVAASLTMVIVSSLAMMAVAAVTFLAIKNNKRLPQKQQNIEEYRKKDKKEEGLKNEEKEYIRQVIEEISSQKEVEKTEKQVVDKKEIPQEPIPVAPLENNGDNRKLLNDLEEEELFKK
jgi:hypothetical protein